MPELHTVVLADGLSVTVRRATVRDSAHLRSLAQRFDEHFARFGDDISGHWHIYKVCATQTVSVEGTDWSPPPLFAGVSDIEANFQDWLAILPTFDAANAWVQAVLKANGPLVPEELTSNADLEDDDPKAPED
jgi:hypothetical protein